jgi:Polyketide cyclase / dehydrase and lipid transport/GyrI-like small molecule binding domain
MQQFAYLFAMELIMIWIFLLAVIAGALIYLLSLPKNYQVQRSITIARPVDDVFEHVRDFRLWKAWSPWLLHDSDCVPTLLNPTEVGGSNAWDSAKIGSGKTTHTAIVKNQSISQTLEFFKPFKSVSQIEWTFSETSGASTVTWMMNASMPLPMRPFIPMMTRMIGLDFELGLGLLRGVLDPSAERPDIQFEGPQTMAAKTCAVQHYEGALGEAMSTAMRTGYPAVYEKAKDRVTGLPLAAYHKVNVVKQTTVCDFGFAVTQSAATDTVLQLAAGRCFQVRYQGSYQFLGSAWNAAMGQVRMQKLKIDTSKPSLEIYTNTPDQVAHSNALVTLLQIPLKG